MAFNLHPGCNITVELQKVLCGIKISRLTILYTETQRKLTKTRHFATL